MKTHRNILLFVILMALMPLISLTPLIASTSTPTFVPANSTPITIKQPNGKTLTFILRGDERISWAETLDGYTLLYNEKGNWEFACLDDYKNLVPSGILACNKDERGDEENTFLKDIKPHIFYSKSQTDSMLNRNH
jgi:immune inhibitor A